MHEEIPDFKAYVEEQEKTRNFKLKTLSDSEAESMVLKTAVTMNQRLNQTPEE